MTNSNLILKGRREPRLGIVQQLAVHIALATTHAQRLNAWGWTPANTAELRAVHDELNTDMAAQAEAKDSRRLASMSQHIAFTEAKDLKRVIDRAVRSMFRRGSVEGVTQEAFGVNGRINRSVPKMLAWLNNVLPAVRILAPQLSRRLGGIDPVAAVQHAYQNLAAADVTQERAEQDLPQDTAAVYEAKGRALVLIADLIDAGRNAFEGEALEAAKFNKDLILRARRQRPPKETKVA